MHGLAAGDNVVAVTMYRTGRVTHITWWLLCDACGTQSLAHCDRDQPRRVGVCAWQCDGCGAWNTVRMTVELARYIRFRGYAAFRPPQAPTPPTPPAPSTLPTPVTLTPD